MNPTYHDNYYYHRFWELYEKNAQQSRNHAAIVGRLHGELSTARNLIETLQQNINDLEDRLASTTPDAPTPVITYPVRKLGKNLRSAATTPGSGKFQVGDSVRNIVSNRIYVIKEITEDGGLLFWGDRLTSRCHPWYFERV